MISDDSKISVYFDIDGVLAKYNNVPYKALLQKGYFSDLEPNHNVVEMCRKLIEEHSNKFEVFVLSSVLQENAYAQEEKNEWLDKYVPWIDREHRLFTTCGSNKADIIGSINQYHVLVDDFNENLYAWREAGGSAVKMVNGINDRTRSWDGERVYYDNTPSTMCFSLEVAILKTIAPDIISIKTRIDNARAEMISNNNNEYEIKQGVIEPAFDR